MDAQEAVESAREDRATTRALIYGWPAPIPRYGSWSGISAM